MCTVTLNINEAEVRELNPSLTDMASINRWAQRVMDDFIASRRRSKEQMKPYTIEELNARIDKAERDSAEGRYRTHDEAMDEIEAELAREKKLKPYTMEEIHAMIAESERQIAAGQYQDFDEAMDEIEAELAHMEAEERAYWAQSVERDLADIASGKPRKYVSGDEFWSRFEEAVEKHYEDVQA